MSSLLLIAFSFFQCTDHTTVPERWEGDISYQNKKWRVAVEMVQEGDSTIAWVDFLDVGGYHRKFRTITTDSSIQLIRAQPNGTSIVFEGKIQQTSFTGKWSGIGIENAVFNLSPAKPVTYTTEAIEVKNDSITLKGNLFLPKGAGPFPAVVITHGGAAEERTVWWGAAVQLAEQGIAAVVYDKRGVGASVGGDWRNDGLKALATDALAFADALKANKNINPKRIGIFGHSEGGWVAPLATTLSTLPTFIIASAPSVDNGSDQTIFHIRNQMRNAGRTEKEIKKAVTLWEQIYNADRLCLEGKADASLFEQAKKSIHTASKEEWFAYSSLPEPYSGECPSKGLLEILFFNPIDIWKQVKVPSLLIWGDQDIVVPADKGYKVIPEIMKAAGNQQVTALMEKNVTHSITLQAGDEWDFPREAPGYFKKIAEWVKRLDGRSQMSDF